MIGWFANNHVLTTECGDDLSFSGLLERVRRVVLGAYAHQEVPFWVVTKMLLTEGEGYEMPERLSEAPYVFFDFDAHVESRPQASRLSVVTTPTPPSAGDAGVEVRVLEHADRLNVSIKYSADRVAPADIGRMLADFQALLQGVVDNPDAPLRDLPLAAPTEGSVAGVTSQSSATRPAA
jgi:non-ribosomal peptide synthetase component F